MCVFRKILIAILIPFLWGGCNKESIPPSLVGNWLWKGSSGGIAGMVINPKPSERTILNFSEDGNYSVFQNDTLVYTGTFRITKAQSIYSGKEELKIETKEVKTGYQQKIRQIIVIGGVVTMLSATRLSTGDNVNDGYGSSFVRN